MNANTALLQKHMQVWLYCKDGCRYSFVAKTGANAALLQGCMPMDASESIIARMNTTIQSMASCFKKKTKQNKEEEESNKSNHRKDYEQK